MSREDGHCMRFFCTAANPSEIRVCACSIATCARIVPTVHKNSVFDQATHAPAGSFLILPAVRKNSPYRDGSFASFLSLDQRQADLQRLSDANVAAAHDLRTSSPENSRSFRDEDEGLPGLNSARGSVKAAPRAAAQDSRTNSPDYSRSFRDEDEGLPSPSPAKGSVTFATAARDADVPRYRHTAPHADHQR
jgi:hypothetical protein